MEPESVAVVLSAVSLLVAGLSLGWQIAQWLLSAGRPRATLYHGVWQGDAALVGPVRKDGRPLDLASLKNQGYDGPEVVGIQVTNHGRAPVTVEKVTVHTRGGEMKLLPVGERLGPDLPYRLEAGTNASWYLDAGHAVRLVTSSREVLNENVTGVYMTAELATGKSVATPRTLQL